MTELKLCFDGLKLYVVSSCYRFLVIQVMMGSKQNYNHESFYVSKAIEWKELRWNEG